MLDCYSRLNKQPSIPIKLVVASQCQALYQIKSLGATLIYLLGILKKSLDAQWVVKHLLCMRCFVIFAIDLKVSARCGHFLRG